MRASVPAVAAATCALLALPAHRRALMGDNSPVL